MKYTRYKCIILCIYICIICVVYIVVMTAHIDLLIRNTVWTVLELLWIVELLWNRNWCVRCVRCVCGELWCNCPKTHTRCAHINEAVQVQIRGPGNTLQTHKANRRWQKQLHMTLPLITHDYITYIKDRQWTGRRRGRKEECERGTDRQTVRQSDSQTVMPPGRLANFVFS